MTTNPSWLLIAVPAIVGGLLLGAAIGWRWRGRPKRTRHAAQALVASAVVAFVVAFFDVAPMVANGLAVLALSAVAALKASRKPAAPTV